MINSRRQQYIILSKIIQKSYVQEGRVSKISVVMPVYNTKEEYFREAIESILNQTFENFEFLIIDNGSDDYIKKVILSYSDQRIKYFRIKQNAGSAEARNLGLKYASSPYVAFLDSDDVAYPERLQKQYDYLENHKDIGCIGTKVKAIGSLSDKVYFPSVTRHKDIELWLLFNGCVFCQSSVMLRREILVNNNIGYDSGYEPAEDYALWLDLVGLTEFAVLEDTLVNYRFYQNNTSNQRKELQYQKGNEVRMKALRKYLGIKDFNAKTWNKFLLEECLSPDEVRYINFIIPQIKMKLISKGYSSQDISTLLCNHFRKLFYHVRTVSGQWLLLTSPLNSYFETKLHWRVFCFLFRGLFSINNRRIK